MAEPTLRLEPSGGDESPSVFDVIGPFGDLLARLPLMEERAVGEAVATARAAQAGWGRISPRERSRHMASLGRVIEGRSDEIIDQLVAETGKPRAEALAEVVVVVDTIRYYCSTAPKHLRRRRIGTGWMFWKSAFVEREPLGVVGAITPWNYPLILPMDALTTALFAGNGLVLKPSEFTPLTSILIAELCTEAGLPEGLVQVVTGDGSTGEALVRSGADRISFTGSTAVGKRVLTVAAERLTPVSLELGGKDPAIVLEDADLDRAARGIAFGAFFNAGQTCISVERAYVDESVVGDFTARVVAVASELRTEGDQRDIGPMITEAQRAKVVGQIEDAVAKGARVLTGGVPADGSRVIPPTVLADVDETMAVLTEETFGPVLPIVPVADQDDAIRRANSSGYGLFASVWTRNRERGLHVGRMLQTGGVSINDTLSHYGVAGLPMGGVGDSGFSRRRGIEGLEEMTHVRSMLVDRFGLKRELWWFPYDGRSTRSVRALLDWSAYGGLAGLLRAARRLVGRA